MSIAAPRDYIGQPLNVGDRVVHARSGRCGGFTGTFYVHSFTAKMVRLRLKAEVEAYSMANPENLVKVTQ